MTIVEWKICMCENLRGSSFHGKELRYKPDRQRIMLFLPLDIKSIKTQGTYACVLETRFLWVMVSVGIEPTPQYLPTNCDRMQVIKYKEVTQAASLFHASNWDAETIKIFASKFRMGVSMLDNKLPPSQDLEFPTIFRGKSSNFYSYYFKEWATRLLFCQLTNNLGWTLILKATTEYCRSVTKLCTRILHHNIYKLGFDLGTMTFLIHHLKFLHQRTCVCVEATIAHYKQQNLAQKSDLWQKTNK